LAGELPLPTASCVINSSFPVKEVVRVNQTNWLKVISGSSTFCTIGLLVTGSRPATRSSGAAFPFVASTRTRSPAKAPVRLNQANPLSLVVVENWLASNSAVRASKASTLPRNVANSAANSSCNLCKASKSSRLTKLPVEPPSCLVIWSKQAFNPAANSYRVIARLPRNVPSGYPAMQPYLSTKLPVEPPSCLVIWSKQAFNPAANSYRVIARLPRNVPSGYPAMQPYLSTRDCKA